MASDVMSGADMVRALIARGMSPVHAAAVVGHAAQESGLNPSAVNPKEDAHGLLQWRLDRWTNLQNYAKSRGLPVSDPNVQLDFIGEEMRGPEAKAGSMFANATDLPGVHAALKKYIRYGDNSDDVRLANARGFLGQAPQQTAMVPGSALLSGGRSGDSPAATGAMVPASTQTAPSSPDNSGQQMMASLQQIAKLLQPPEAPISPMPDMVTPQMMKARAIAAALQGTQTS